MLDDEVVKLVSQFGVDGRVISLVAEWLDARAQG